MSNEAERWGEEMLADLKDQQRQSRRGTVPREVADRLAAVVTTALACSDLEAFRDDLVMALADYRKAVSGGN